MQTDHWYRRTRKAPCAGASSCREGRIPFKSVCVSCVLRDRHSPHLYDCTLPGSTPLPMTSISSGSQQLPDLFRPCVAAYRLRHLRGHDKGKLSRAAHV